MNNKQQQKTIQTTKHAQTKPCQQQIHMRNNTHTLQHTFAHVHVHPQLCMNVSAREHVNNDSQCKTRTQTHAYIQINMGTKNIHVHIGKTHQTTYTNVCTQTNILLCT